MIRVSTISEIDGGADRAVKVYDSMGAVSDGYHTFDELYEFRMLICAKKAAQMPLLQRQLS